MVDYKLVGNRLKKYREAKKFTQELVAEQANITVVYLSKIENGKVHPTLDTLRNLCSVVGCDLGEILLNISSESDHYQNERIVQLFNACSPAIKPVALNLLEQLAKIH